MRLDQGKGSFFDKPAVMRRMDARTRRVLSRFGAFVRRRDQTSQRKRKAVSEPGQPPSSHLGLIRKHTFFAYEEQAGRKSVVIGPALLGREGGADALRGVEQGGASEVATGRKGKRKTVTVRIRPRPHTKPAFDAELPGLSRMWAEARGR